MCRSSRWPLTSRLWAGLAPAFVAMPVAAQASAPIPLPVESSLVLAVSIDGVLAPEPILVRRDAADRLSAKAEDLRALHLPTATRSGWVALDDIAPARCTLDVAAQALACTGGSDATQRLSAGWRDPTDAMPLTPNGWGATLGYDLTATASRVTSVAGAFQATAFTPGGVAFTGGIVDSGQRTVRRLDTGFTTGLPDRLMRATVGDFVTAASSTGRPLRLGGARLATDFSLRPDLITFPVPTISISAVVPSGVDLIVDGTRRAIGDVRAGQFAITDLPLTTGVNTVTVAVRDALGRDSLQTVTTYASRALLARGLSAYSAEAGFIRTGYAGDHDRYRSFAVSGSWRRGLSERVTVEGHAESGGGATLGTAGAQFGLGALGLIDASIGVSRAYGRTGTQWAIGMERIARPVSFSVRYTAQDTRWRDVAAGYGAGLRRHMLVANLGFDLGRGGTFGAGLIDLGHGQQDTNPEGRRLTDPGIRIAPTTLVNASWSTTVVHRINLVATLAGEPRRHGGLFTSIGAILTFGPRSSVLAGVASRGGDISASADYQRVAVSPGDLGYRAVVSSGKIERQALGLEYIAPQANFQLQAEQVVGRGAVRATVRGAVALFDGALYAAHRIDDSFAVVDTNGQAGVTIYRDNRPVGVTDRRGHLMVPQLNGYQAAKFSLDPNELAYAVELRDSDAYVRPRDRVGVAVRFILSVNDAALVRLVDSGGAPIPPGARVQFGGSDVPVGFDGMVYLRGFDPTNFVIARLPDGRACAASFAGPIRGKPGQVIGPVACNPLQIAAMRNELGPRP